MNTLIAVGTFIAGLFTLWYHSQMIKTVPEPAPETPPEPQNDPVSPLPTEPTPTPMYDFSTPKKAWHASRVIMDEYGLAPFEKDLLCSCIYQESNFMPGAIGKPNSNGTRDYGLCQYNNGTLGGRPLWIGKGAVFKDIAEVLSNPEKNVRVMVKEYKAGHLKYWSSFATGANKQWLKPGSKMWSLKN